MSAQWTGMRLGSYELGDLLGSGGMASVYRGYDTALEREVAVKVIGTRDQPPTFVARFKREARLLAGLRHPHIVQIYHFGEERDCVYMVQELLAGPTLDGRLRTLGRRRMPPAEVHQVVEQVAAALDYAHGKGIVHRDVKPSNIIYNSQGQLMLTDFGIARSPADAHRTATAPGVVMGTPGYVAPEQAIGGATLTPACDIYSLGVVLFELLVGKLPFDADTPMGVVLKHLYEEPLPPSTLRADLPRELDRLIAQALHKEPERRYARAGDLLLALQRAWPLQRAAGAAAEPLAPAARPRATAKRATPVAAAQPKAASVRVRATPPAPPRDARPVPATAAPARTTPRRKVAIAPAAKPDAPAAPPQISAPRRSYRLRVALVLACIVAALIVFHPSSNALAEAWAGALEAARMFGLR